MIVLAFDTALAACSVALYDAGRDELLAVRHQPVVRGHAELLPGMIQSVMAERDLAMAALDRIAVTRGPGTFTGVRIALATARGLAFALRRPAVGITTLEALAAAVASHDDTPVASVIDARRGEVYLQMFAADGGALDEARLVTVDTAVHEIPDRAVVVGTGAGVLAAAGCRALAACAPSLPDAAAFVRRAVRLDPQAAPPEPLYLRAPDAKPQASVVTMSSLPVSLIEAGPAHAAVLAGLHASAFDRAWSQAELATLLQAPGALALLAVVGEGELEPAGFVLARRAADEAEILAICTRPAARRRGVARRLLAALTAALAQQGTKSLFLEVDAGNDDALGLYRHLGFVATGRRSGYYPARDGKPGDALVMRREVHPG
jgi:tRNA threonylcarbamoyl adenosine modification protein YeaZ